MVLLRFVFQLVKSNNMIISTECNQHYCCNHLISNLKVVNFHTLQLCWQDRRRCWEICRQRQMCIFYRLRRPIVNIWQDIFQAYKLIIIVSIFYLELSVLFLAFYLSWLLQIYFCLHPKSILLLTFSEN